jgi:hypothetical protein
MEQSTAMSAIDRMLKIWKRISAFADEHQAPCYAALGTLMLFHPWQINMGDPN